MARHKRTLSAVVAASALLVCAVHVYAQSAGASPDDPKADENSLAAQEKQLAEKYKHLEDVLLRMAELTASEDPRRAALLKKAVAQSKDRLITVRLNRLVELLDKDRLAQALEDQSEVDRDLRALLELLLSENRAKHLENEKARVREFLRQIGLLIKQQKDVQGRTAGGDDAKRLADQQAGVAQSTNKLAEQVKTSQGADGKSSDAKSENGEESKSPSSPPKESSENSPEDRLDAARQRMNEAEAKLREAQRQNASDKQEEAIRELELAKAKFEEILRQLREEEILRTLVMLEARFRKMLDMQNEVYEGTVRLDRVPEKQRTHDHEIEAGRLGARQSQIVVEVDKALLLLRDDGSAAAFIEAAEQIREDMRMIGERLAKVEVGAMTQAVEEEVIAALKEMIESLKKAQKDQESKKTPPGQSPPPGQPQEPPLVDMLAELRMIRALQMRVNVRTERYSKLIDGEQASTEEMIAAVRQLAERQRRIQQITRDLDIGKNQ